MNAPLIEMGGVAGHSRVRIRYQFLGGLIFATRVPLLVRMLLAPGVLFSINHQVTITAVVIVHVTGYFVYRRLGASPGVAATGAMLPTLALAYEAVFLLMFFFRFGYSRFQAAAPF